MTPEEPAPALYEVDPGSPEARDLAADERDQAGERRDDAAGERHLQANLRDVTAARRDELGQELLSGYTADQLLRLYVTTQQGGAADRRYASADRRADAEDRYSAGRDRHAAAVDRQASAFEREEASLDHLTGAYNRAAGFKELRRDVDRARRTPDPFTLAFVDVDGLKTINDAHGHAAGDRALVHVVFALRAHLRAHDLIIRFGGDEFLCAVASMDDADLNARLALVSEALQAAPEQVHITVGLAKLEPNESVEDLFGRADAAFYAIRKRR